MFMEICVAVIALTLAALTGFLIRISSQIQTSIHLLQTDLRMLSIETARLLNSMNDFVRADLHTLSEETHHVMRNLKDLSSDLSEKSHSLNFLFKPFGFLNCKLGSGSSPEEPEPKNEAIPQILKWVASSVFLIKKTKELIKNHEK